MRIRHYYHVYAAGAWSAPVRDHFTALGRAGLDDITLTIGLVGPEQDRAMALERVRELCRKWDIPQPSEVAERDEGWEQVTLQQVYDDLRRPLGDYAVLYAHTKGAANDLDSSAAWRRSMTRQLVGGWEECLRQLKACDAVGCHWVKAPEWPDQEPFFAGNFWWATSRYLRTLDPPLSETRWQAETWVSLGKPDVHDLLPHWPDYG